MNDEQRWDSTRAAIFFFSIVDRYAKNAEWTSSTTLQTGDRQTVMAVMGAAGFRDIEMVRGTLKDETGTVNNACPYMIKSTEGQDDIRATGWLDCLVRLALKGLDRLNGDERTSEGIQALRIEIDRSNPLEPIPLNEFGDILVENPRPLNSSEFPYFVEHSREEDTVGPASGIHAFCGGILDRVDSSATHDALVCQKCQMLASFPKAVRTFGDLRKALTPVKSTAPAATVPA